MTTKYFYWNGLLTILVILLTSLTGCENGTTDGGMQTSGAGQTIGAAVELSNLTVQGASEGTFLYAPIVSYIPSAITGGTAQVRIEGGKLTIKLYDVTMAGRGTAEVKIHTGVTATPADARFLYIREFENSAATKTLGCYGAGSKQLSLIWADRDATLGGSYTMGPSTFSFSGVNLKQGWNFLLQDSNNGGVTFTHTATRTFPSGYTWQVF